MSKSANDMTGMKPSIRLKRAYDPPAEDDGARVLVDRLWPRGLSRKDAHLDLWLKEIGPSDELRRWFNHEPQRFTEFARRYRAELRRAPDGSQALHRLIGEGPMTLLFGARDREHNQARVLADLLLARKSAPRMGRE